MKNYKKGLLTLAVLSSMALIAATDKTIYVNTFADEDGENLDKCSLREALNAATLHKAYGGCTAGQPYDTVDTVIQLEAGEYKLNKELRPNSSVYIKGKEPSDYSKKDVLTNAYPASTAPKTTISGQGKTRIFNTIYGNKPTLTLNNIILKDGSSLDDTNNNVGGALYLGGTTTLNNVSIINARSKQGAAIYLNDINSGLTINKGNFTQNIAEQGSVLAMSCLDNLTYTLRNININYASIYGNGDVNSKSMMNFCGLPSATLTANTITNNIADANSGSIIQFSAKSPHGTQNFGLKSSLILQSNTIVKNNAWSTLLYGLYGVKNLSSNILAYNGSGKSCRYADGDVAEVKNSAVTLGANAITLAAGNDQCEMPDEVLKEFKDVNIDLSNINFSTILSELQEPTEYVAFMPMYFPKDNKSSTDLVDTKFSGCSTLDQRGVTRLQEGTSLGENEVTNSCDIGATEVLRLTANILTSTNTSVVTLIDGYQKELDIYNKLIADTTTNPDYLPFYKIQSEMYANLMKYTKSDQKYRTIFADPFVGNLPDEEILANGGRKVKHLDIENYDITAEAVGVGMLDENNKFNGVIDKNLHCEWNSNLKKILVWRTDDSITPSGDTEFCKYSLITKTDPKKSSTAYIMATFTNIAPIANAITFDIQPGSNQIIDTDLLTNASDDGDGLTSTLINKPNKPKFYINENGDELPIRIDKSIDPVLITADRSGPCPGLDRKNTCYGGKLHIQLKNTLDPFSYHFDYYVYDADGMISNKATVTLNNSGSSKTGVRETGGGSLGWLSLVGLIGLAGYRRYKMNGKAK